MYVCTAGNLSLAILLFTSSFSLYTILRLRRFLYCIGAAAAWLQASVFGPRRKLKKKKKKKRGPSSLAS